MRQPSKPAGQQPELEAALCRWRDAVRAFQAAALAEELGETDDAGASALWTPCRKPSRRCSTTRSRSVLTRRRRPAPKRSVHDR